jgi:hypothetical protein
MRLVCAFSTKADRVARFVPDESGSRLHAAAFGFLVRERIGLPTDHLHDRRRDFLEHRYRRAFDLRTPTLPLAPATFSVRPRKPCRGDPSQNRVEALQKLMRPRPLETLQAEPQVIAIYLWRHDAIRCQNPFVSWHILRTHGQVCKNMRKSTPFRHYLMMS